jgi:hypothetical protein
VVEVLHLYHSPIAARRKWQLEWLHTFGTHQQRGWLQAGHHQRKPRLVALIDAVTFSVDDHVAPVELGPQLIQSERTDFDPTTRFDRIDVESAYTDHCAEQSTDRRPDNQRVDMCQSTHGSLK